MERFEAAPENWLEVSGELGQRGTLVDPSDRHGSGRIGDELNTLMTAKRDGLSVSSRLGNLGFAGTMASIGLNGRC